MSDMKYDNVMKQKKRQKRMGRPPVPDPRSEKVTVRLTKGQAAALREAARTAGQTLTAYILAKILRE
jgi:predicted HicB family RNase H-like nuclease